MNWTSITEWMLSFGQEYGVDPIIFALLYFGTIPFSILSFSYLVRNIRKEKPLFWPIFGAFLCYIGTYVYLFAVGRNIPLWVYGVILAMMSYSGYYFFRKLRQVQQGGN